jgi:hypothetical protein
LCILCLTTALQGQSRQSVLKGVSESSDWKPLNTPTEYDESSLEKLAGPQAEVLRRYGFAGASVQDWTRPDGSARLTIYEMVDPSAAYAIFTIERDVRRRGYDALPVGTEGFRLPERLSFWQSKYVVRVDGEAQVAEGLARVVSQNILGPSIKPPVSNLLPPLHLVAGSDRYILFPEDVDSRLQLDPAALGFDDSVEVATATYRIQNRPAELVLMLYPTQQIAKKYADQWDVALPETASFRKRVGPLVAWVHGTRDSEVAGEILGPVNYETQVTWNEPRPDVSLREVILTIFTFIGIGLMFVVIAGISFGGIRVFVKAWYPNKVFDRAQDIEIIQLKLPKGVTPRQIRE